MSYPGLSAASSLYDARPSLFFFFFFNDTATTEIYTLSLHDALPIFYSQALFVGDVTGDGAADLVVAASYADRSSTVKDVGDRKSTRLNSSHLVISYAVFCLKKKKKTTDRSSSCVRRDHVMA